MAPPRGPTAGGYWSTGSGRGAVPRRSGSTTPPRSSSIFDADVPSFPAPDGGPPMLDSLLLVLNAVLLAGVIGAPRRARLCARRGPPPGAGDHLLHRLGGGGAPRLRRAPRTRPRPRRGEVDA